MAHELLAIQDAQFKIFPAVKKYIILIRENWDRLSHYMSISAECRALCTSFKESLIYIEDNMNLNNFRDSAESKAGSGDKLFNTLHGVMGHTASLKEAFVKLKELLHMELDFGHSQKLEVITNSIQENIDHFEKCLSDQEDILNRVIESPKDSPTISASSFWDIRTSPLPKTKKKVLIVDDSSVNRKILGNFLKEYDCHYASDGLEAVKKYKEIKPDITLMDIIMPQMTGIEAAAVIRKYEAHEALSSSLIIAVTASPSAEVFDSMDGCLVKPFKQDAIIQIIKDKLKIKNVIQEYSR